MKFLNEVGLGQLWNKIKILYALKTEVPENTSDLTNDSNFISEIIFDGTKEEWNLLTPEVQLTYTLVYLKE